MFHKLKRRLFLLYWITSSIILTIIMIGVIYINFNQNQAQSKMFFQKNAEQIIEKIRTSHSISTTWLADLWNESHLIIMVEENGKQLNYYSQLNISIKTAELTKEIKKYADEEGIYIDQRPFTSEIMKTSVYSLKDETHQPYLGMAAVIPLESGWQSFIIVNYDVKRYAFILRQILLLSSIDLIGIAALFVMSSFYIGKVMNPLEEGQRKQNAFVAAASHELRSPLTVIKAGITSIKEDITKADQFLPHIEGECDRMTRLISDMLLLASADAKTWSLVKEKLDMDTLLIECYDMFCICYNNKNYQLTLDLPEENLYNIYGDRERIQQILTILVDNAMNHSPDGGRIILRAYNQKHSIIIEIEDHGSGISGDDKKHVFERFYKGDQSRNEKKHFGLGLSIAKELVELHEGEISLKDTIGGGATFIIRLPKYS